MITGRLKSYSSAASTVAYQTIGEAHHGGGPRSLGVRSKGCTPESFAKVARDLLGVGGRGSVTPHDGKPEVWAGLLSFDRSEVDPDDPEQVQWALDVAAQIIERVAPGFPYIAVGQADGQAAEDDEGIFHVHYAIPRRAASNATAAAKKRTKTPDGDELRDVEVSVQAGHALPSALKSLARMRAISDEVLAEHGFDNEALMREHARAVPGAPYNYVDDARGRVFDAAAEAETVDEWGTALADQAVALTLKKGGYSLTFIDAEGKKRTIRVAKTDRHGMGSDAHLEALNKIFEANRDRHAAEREAAAAVAANTTVAELLTDDIDELSEPLPATTVEEPKTPVQTVAPAPVRLPTPAPDPLAEIEARIKKLSASRVLAIQHEEELAELRTQREEIRNPELGAILRGTGTTAPRSTDRELS